VSEYEEDYRLRRSTSTYPRYIRKRGTDRKVYIYFIQAADDDDAPVKIGQTLDVDKRLETLQTASPVELRVRCAIWAAAWVEHVFHDLFSDLRIRGEWFRPDARVSLVMRAIDCIGPSWRPTLRRPRD
jgi:hypothetical protein